uniref:Uncharacterized protein n=2 Tax=Leptocylindrus danicus TaxID=163516 RepID=A0A7S2KNF1_9STRA|mmetsp:Transcript_24650/g.36937  ORF Transcript_24650/g.36937 Transcript_24650/m.36937 type:complete len:889 (+) Transcript_24650:181-2847(+)|eukprot:CAMPEP_0116024094 /NCGR_PEP_ID=MMETSP0321-20121206/12083_1 /TAXON_ID=163516 /ORGANISM="Leptocylindrus danicus var. danicus, Strain B650" /LENGTH=888 /DNA_ID=CAMNT_0003495701 /DNA_START=237 /DNA_END=2903 /DNA_ORIENTATION=-
MCFNTPFDAYQYSTASTPPNLNTGGAIYVNARRLSSANSTTTATTGAPTAAAAPSNQTAAAASSLLNRASSFAAANNVATTPHSQHQEMIIVSSAPSTNNPTTAAAATAQYNTATSVPLNMNMNMNINTAAANSAVTAAMNEAAHTLQQYGHHSSGASVTSLPTIAQYNPNATSNSSTLSHSHHDAFYNTTTQGLSISRGLGVNTIRQSVAEQAHHQLRGVTTPRGTAQQQIALHRAASYTNPNTSNATTLAMNSGVNINSGSAAAMFATAHRGVNVRTAANLAGFNGMVARGLSTTRVALNGGLGLVDPPSFATNVNTNAVTNTPPLLQQQQRSRVAGRTMMLGEMDEHKTDLNLNLNSGISNDTNANSNNMNNNSNKLSDLHSFVRMHCIEVFSCTPEDVEKHPRSKGTRRARLGQVGLRCVHCKHLPLRELANQSISFPTSTAHIYESVRNWHRFHFDLCQHIPRDIRQKYNALKRQERSSKTGRFATKEYFTESAKRMGMVDTRSGIFFADDDVALRSIHLNLDNAHPLPVTNLAGDVKLLVSSVLERAMMSPHANQLVLQEHRKYVTDCTWLLYCQLQTCCYKSNGTTTSTADNNNSKGGGQHHSKLLGLECRHCMAENKQDRHGRYYPSTEKKLSDASFSQCVYLHMIKCEMCPYDVKKALESLHMLNAMQRAQLKRGSKKRFFSIIWQKMQQQQRPSANNNPTTPSMCNPHGKPHTSNAMEVQQQQHVSALSRNMNAAAAAAVSASDLLPRLSHHHHAAMQQQHQQYPPSFVPTTTQQTQQPFHHHTTTTVPLSGLHTHQASGATLIPHHTPHAVHHHALPPHLNHHHHVNMNTNGGGGVMGGVGVGGNVSEDVVENGSAGSTPEEREDAKLIIQFATANC